MVSKQLKKTIKENNYKNSLYDLDFKLLHERIQQARKERKEQIKFKWGTIFFTILGGFLLFASVKLFLLLTEYALDLYFIDSIVTPMFIILVIDVIFAYKVANIFLNQGAEFFKKVKKW